MTTKNALPRKRGRPKTLFNGEVYHVWLDAPARERVVKLRRLFAGTIGVAPTTSVIVRAAIKALSDRADCVAGLGAEGSEIGFLALRNDVRDAAMLRGETDEEGTR